MVTCPICKGEGEYWYKDRRDGDMAIAVCRYCDGSGEVPDGKAEV